MRIEELIAAFDKAGKRTHFTGDKNAGVLAALDMEGRLFTVLNGEVISRVNPDAVYNQSSRAMYYNPGGDVLWPAPEGTSLGFQYPTGKWAVPAGIRHARYQVDNANDSGCTISCEIDLVNNQGIGIPVLFRRQLAASSQSGELKLDVTESITYCGNKVLDHSSCILAPWTLSQFNCGPECEVLFSCSEQSSVWDLYDETIADQLDFSKDIVRVSTEGTKRFQIGLGAGIPWIEFRDPKKGLVVRRKAAPLVSGQYHIDIRDASPDTLPDERGARYSIYNDAAGFMEIEAAGGCPQLLSPGMEMTVSVSTLFSMD